MSKIPASAADDSALPCGLCRGTAEDHTDWKAFFKVPNDQCLWQVASAVFVQPPLGTCGLTEEQAIERVDGEIDVFVSKVRSCCALLPMPAYCSEVG